MSLLLDEGLLPPCTSCSEALGSFLAMISGFLVTSVGTRVG